MTKLAAQLFTVRDFTKTEEDFEATIKKLSEMGYEAVQVSAIGPISAQRVAEITEKYHMVICATHNPISRICDDTDNLIAEHKIMGCRYIGLGAAAPEVRQSMENLRATVEKLKIAGKRMQEEGMQFVYHNHHFDFERVEGQLNFFEAVEEMDPEGYIGFLVDTYWVQSAGLNPCAFIEKYKHRIKVVHLKDMQIVDGKATMAEIGVGNMDFKAIVETCEKCGVEWYPIEQDTCLYDPFACLEKSLKYCKEELGL